MDTPKLAGHLGFLLKHAKNTQFNTVMTADNSVRIFLNPGHTKMLKLASHASGHQLHGEALPMARPFLLIWSHWYPTRSSMMELQTTYISVPMLGAG